MSDHNYCRVSARDFECGNRQRIQVSERFLETGQAHVLPGDKYSGDTGNRSICLSGVTSTPSLHIVESRSTKSGPGCLSKEVESPICLCISPLLPNRSGVGKRSKGTSLYDSDNSGLASTAMVSKTSANVCSKSNLITGVSKTFDQSVRKPTSSNTEQNSKTSGVTSFRKSFEADGIPERNAYLKYKTTGLQSKGFQ